MKGPNYFKPHIQEILDGEEDFMDELLKEPDL